MTLTPTSLAVVTVAVVAILFALAWLWRPHDSDRLFTGDERRQVET